MKMWKKVLIAFGVTAVLLAPFLREQEEKTHELFSAHIRILNGTRTICSGFVVNDSYAITAAHCVKNSIFEVKSENGEDISFVNVIYFDQYFDMAILLGNFEAYKKIKIKNSGMEYPSELISSGFPFGGKLVSNKIYCQTNYQNKSSCIGMLHMGASGGAVIDSDGYAVGINHGFTSNRIVVSPFVNLDSLSGLDLR